jgi:hypothetical protein
VLTEQVAAMALTSQRFTVGTPLRYSIIVVAVALVGQFWLLRPAPFRVAAQRAGWRLALAVLSSITMLAFGVGIALGQLEIAILALIVGAPPTCFLLIRLIRDGSRRTTVDGSGKAPT